MSRRVLALLTPNKQVHSGAGHLFERPVDEMTKGVICFYDPLLEVRENDSEGTLFEDTPESLLTLMQLPLGRDQRVEADHMGVLAVGREPKLPDRVRELRLDPLLCGQRHAIPRGGGLKGFAAAAVANSMGPHPDVAYSWYVDFLKWIRDDSYGWIGPVVSLTELVIGVLLIIGLFTGIAAFVGATLKFSYVFAGTAGVNPLFIIISLFLIVAWRVAGWYGLDRIVLPKLGTPWQPGSRFNENPPESARAPTSGLSHPVMAELALAPAAPRHRN